MFASHFARVKSEKQKKAIPSSAPSASKGEKDEEESPRRKKTKQSVEESTPPSTRKETGATRSPDGQSGKKKKRRSSDENSPRKRIRNEGRGPRRPRPSPEALELSRQLQNLSRQKRSADLIKLFWRREYAKIRDNFHACIVVDCCSRCGEVVAAEKVVHSLPKESVSIETKTALLKCYAHSGKMAQAMTLFRKMCQSPTDDQKPNVRSLNTLLRGCLWTAATEEGNSGIVGGVISSEEAWAIYKKIHAEKVDAVDTSSYEATIILLCQALRMEEAQGRIQELQDQYGIKCKGKASIKGGDQSSLETCGIAYLALARAWALLGKVDDMWIACQRCLHAIQSSMSKIDEDTAAPDITNPAKVVKSTDRGGKRGWKVDASEEGQRRAASNLTYRKHRLTEVENEARALLKSRKNAEEQSASAAILRARLETKILYFAGGATSGNNQNNKDPGSHCAVWNSFGLASLAKTDSSIKRDNLNSGVTSKANGPLDVSAIFGKEKKNDPVDVEIGSGFGDWIVRQALAFSDRNHFAVELRADRVYQIFSRATLVAAKSLDNLCVVGSDAGDFLREKLSKSSVASIFANHPEPPTQTLGQNISHDLEGIMDGATTEPIHMLNSSTLGSAADVLQKGGRLVIVTDNRNYANLVAATFIRLLRRQKGTLKCLDPNAAKKMKLKQIESFPDDVFLYEGQPNLQIGHARDNLLSGQSYFDRLWKTGASKHSDTSRRYIVVFYKR